MEFIISYMLLQAISEFTFTPQNGEIQPLSKTTVAVKFTPTSIKSIKRVFEVSVEDGNEW